MITLCWEAEKITITKEELTLLTSHVRVPQTLKGNNMYTLHDLDISYVNPSFSSGGKIYWIKKGRKNCEIRSANTLEVKKCKLNAIEKYLPTTELKIDKKTVKFYLNHYKKFTKTTVLKEIVKQLKDSRVASS